MDNEFENIVPWNGANDTGRDVRLKWQRNFERIKANFEEVLKLLGEVDVEKLAKYFIRKDKEDQTDHLVKFLAGLEVGEFIDSLSAGKGTKLFSDGRGQMNILELRKQIQIGEAILFWDDTNKGIGVKRASSPASEDGTGEVKENEIGIYSLGWMSAKGIDKGEEEGSGAGSTTIGGLTNVGSWADQTADYDRIMVQLSGSNTWTEKRLDEIVGGLDEEQLAAYLTENNYAKIVDIPSLDGYATQSWVLGKGYATTSDLDSRIDALVNGAPAAFDTLKEIADVLQGNVDSIGDILTTLGTKADKSISILAGTGLAGGGTLSANRTLSLKPATTSALGGIIVGDRLSVDSSGRLTATYTYTHPPATATTIAAATGKVLSAITVNSLGHVTSVAAKTLAAADIPSLAISKIAGLQDELDKKLDASVLNDLFEKVTVNGVTAIRAKYGLFTNEFLSAKGMDEGEEGGSGSSYLSDLLDVSLTSLATNDLLKWNGTKWINVPQSSIVPNLVWGNITGKPTTLAGYGIQASDLLSTIKTVDGSGSGLDADTLDGYEASKFYLNGYVMFGYTIDASNLDENTYYPVTFYLGSNKNVRIECIVSLNSNTNPSWATHTNGFSVKKIWESNGNAWGTINVTRRILASDYLHATSDPVRGIGQMLNSGNEYVYVRGGGKYYFYVSHNVKPELRTGIFTSIGQSISPTTDEPDQITRNVAFITDTVAAADKLTVNAGSNTNPIYFTGGIPKASSYSFGNASGNIAINNGILNVNLNADLFDGVHLDGLLTSVTSNSMANLSITVGGTTKTVSDLYAAYTEKLLTARTIWGQTFDGTKDVTGALTGVTSISASGDVNVNRIIITDTDIVKHIELSRVGYNYITTPTGGTLAINVSGGTTMDSSSLIISKGQVFAGSNNSTLLGTSSYRWSGLYSVLGNFSGAVTLGSTLSVSGLITANSGLHTPQYLQVGDGRIYWDATNKALYVKGSDGTAIGFYSNGWMSAKGVDEGEESGSSGDGMTEKQMWEYLADAGTEQIALNHLTTALTGYATQSWVLGKGFLTSVPTHNHSWANITSGKPTTLAGYGITDGVNTITISGSGNAVSDITLSGHTLTVKKTNISGSGSTGGVTAINISGSGNAVTSASISGNTLTLTRGSNFLLTTGNAYSASKLQTPRTIWGQTFDGTANIDAGKSLIVNVIRDASNSYNYASDGNGNLTIGTTALSHTIKFNTSSGTALYINDNKNIGIDTTSPSYKLHVNGSMYATSYANSSDMRLKKKRSDITLAVSSIANAPTFIFNWINDGSIDIGSSAQYWKDILPEIVVEKNGYYVMPTANIALVSVICLAKSIEAIEHRIAKLERENEELKCKLYRLSA